MNGRKKILEKYEKKERKKLFSLVPCEANAGLQWSVSNMLWLSLQQ